MGKTSREDDLLELFFNEPTKQWHFKDIKKAIHIPDNNISRWLKIFQAKGIIEKTRPEGKMPHYLAKYESAEYRSLKRLFAASKLHKSGLIRFLLSLADAKTIIIFGSFTRWDWHKGSDIDIFIYGDTELDLSPFEEKLSHQLHVFRCTNRKDFEKLGHKLIKSIVLGDLIKGDVSFFEVSIHAEA